MLDRLLVDRRFRLARKWSNDQLRALCSHFTGDVVNVSAWRDEDKEGGHYRDYFPNAASYSLTNYSGTSGAQGFEGEIPLDLTAPLPEDLRERFDVVYNHTTLEHVYEVQQAIENLAGMSRDVVIVVVPFSQVHHEVGTYEDFWRFTPTALRRAFGEHGFEEIYCSANEDPNAAVYVLYAASRNPDRWRGVLPAAPSGWLAGDRIGRSMVRSVAGRVVRLLRR